jgi:hypothetical protein
LPKVEFDVGDLADGAIRLGDPHSAVRADEQLPLTVERQPFGRPELIDEDLRLNGEARRTTNQKQKDGGQIFPFALFYES